MTNPVTARCPACGAPASGRFCTECGTPVGRRRCRVCDADLSPGARFCHRCGAEDRPGVPPQRERTAWIAATAMALLAVALVAYFVGRGRTPAPVVPDMGNAGNAGLSEGRAPDISQMSPRERFDRLFDRVIGAAERQANDTVTMFAPMAIGAYQQLPQVDTDARYHAAMIYLAAGQLAPAKALADTILAQAPDNLLAYLVRGEAAERENDQAALAKAYRDFLAHVDAELQTGRDEYVQHRPAIDDFRIRAQAQKP